MNFFTKKSIQQSVKRSGSTGEHWGTNSFSQKKALIISLFFALLLLIGTFARAAENTVPVMPGLITGQKNVCAYVGTMQQINYSISPVAGAQLYLWTVPATVQIISGQGTTNILVSFGAGFNASPDKQIKVRSISQEGNSADRILYLASQQPTTPASIAGPSNACIYIGTPNQATYTIAKDLAATSYIWGTDPNGTMITHPNGPGVNDTIIRVTFKAGYKTSPVTVQSVNNCGFSAARSISVSGAAPSTPGIISGPTNACAYMLPNGTYASYSIAPVTGATSYTWITPADCIVDHPNGAGGGDVTINVQFPGTFTSGTITVIASSGCDDSPPRNLNISKLNPSTPGIITAAEKITCPDREYSYTLPSMPANATSITWTVPAESVSFTGQGGVSIMIRYPEVHVNGLVTAKAVNNCATSATRQAVVSLGRCQQERGVAANGAKGGRSGQENSTGQQKQAALTDITAFEKTGITVSPNPSKGNFKLQVNTNEKAVINIKLLDLQGREVKKMSMNPGQPFYFGTELKPGTYVIEISQGQLKHTEKLLKL